MGEISESGPRALDWVTDRERMPPGRYISLFDGKRTFWAFEPVGEPLANGVTNFGISYEDRIPAGTEGWARAHAPDGDVVEELRFVFTGGPCWVEAY